MRYFVHPLETVRVDDARVDDARVGAPRHAAPQTAPPSRGAFVELRDGTTHYELAGPPSGDVVVCIGGLTVPLLYWDAVVPVLRARGLRTLTFSGYGRGLSARARVAYGEPLFVRQLADLRAALDVRAPMHVVGASMGALVAAGYALAHRSSVATLTLIGPAGVAGRALAPHRLLWSDRIARLLARRFGRRILEGHLGHNVRDPRRAAELEAMVLDAFRCEGSLHAFFDTLQHVPLFGRADVYRRVGALGVPTLLLWGAQDAVTPAAQIGDARALLRPAAWHVIDDCGHMAPFERPADVGEHVARFVGSHPSNGETRGTD